MRVNMFGLFKSKRPDAGEAVIVAANNIACDFSDFVAAGRVKPGLVYDVSALPHSKDLLTSPLFRLHFATGL
jgi:hypothetical protein